MKSFSGRKLIFAVVIVLTCIFSFSTLMAEELTIPKV